PSTAPLRFSTTALRAPFSTPFPYTTLFRSHHVRITSAREIERLPRAERHHAHLNPGFLLKHRQDVSEQPRLLGRSGRSNDDELVLRAGGGRGDPRHEQQEPSDQVQGSSPLMNAAACADWGFEKNCSTGARSTSRPWLMNRISSPSRRACPRLCVAITTFVPAASNALITDSISRVALGSRLAVGSSRNSTSGCSAQARASASR